MPALTFGAYAVYAYVVLPLLVQTFHALYSSRYQICPLVICLQPLIKCVREPQCKDLIDQLQECQNDDSEARQRSARTFAHVQHPNDPSFCRYQAFDTISTGTAMDFLECVGSSGCLEPSLYSDECAALRNTPVLGFEVVEPILEGTWVKLYSTGWDTWSCQRTEFHPPHSADPLPEAWMTAWPQHSRVWRMDLSWSNGSKNSTAEPSTTFHMCNEMYPGQQWSFDQFQTTSTTAEAAIAHATLKTRAVMWGTEAHENWYLLDYDKDSQTMLIYYCAYTMDIDRFDSMAMVLRKKDFHQQHPYTTEMRKSIEAKALELLGEMHGRLQRIEECPHDPVGG